MNKEEYIRELRQLRTPEAIVALLRQMPTVWPAIDKEQAFKEGVIVVDARLAKEILLALPDIGTGWTYWIKTHKGLTRDSLEVFLGENLETFRNGRADDWAEAIGGHLTGCKDPWVQAMHQQLQKQSLSWHKDKDPAWNELTMAKLVLRQADLALEDLDWYATSLIVKHAPGLGARCLAHPATTSKGASQWQKYWKRSWGTASMEAIWYGALSQRLIEEEELKAMLRFIPHKVLLDLLFSSAALQENPKRFLAIFEALGPKRTARAWVDLLVYRQQDRLVQAITRAIKDSRPEDIRAMGRATWSKLIQSGQKDVVMAVMKKLAEAQKVGAERRKGSGDTDRRGKGRAR